MTDEEYEKAQEMYEAWRKLNEVLHRLIEVLLSFGRENGLTLEESAAEVAYMVRTIRDYKHGPPCTFMWPVGGFIEQVKL